MLVVFPKILGNPHYDTLPTFLKVLPKMRQMFTTGTSFGRQQSTMGYGENTTFCAT